MGFRLPYKSELSIEQNEIVNLKPTINWVIQGAPGTGKTVMAIYRAAHVSSMARFGKKVLMLVYNRNLMEFMREAVEEYANCDVLTYHQWLSDIYRSEFGCSYPQSAPYTPEWDKIEPKMMRLGKKYTHIIIDEAQDFPIELLRILNHLADNITCFIDPNQAIEAGKTSALSIIKKLCLESSYELLRNYRNTKEIRDASSIFCKSGTPARSLTSGPKPIMVECDDYDDEKEYIASIARNNKDACIGVIVNNKNINNYYRELSEELDGEVTVQATKAKTDKKIMDYNEPGLQIVSFGTMKGLEFDIVIIPRCECIYDTGDDTINANRMYVALSRAKQRLFIVHFSDYCSSRWYDCLTPIKNNRSKFDWRRA